MFISCAVIFGILLSIGAALLNRPEGMDPTEKAKAREAIIKKTMI